MPQGPLTAAIATNPANTGVFLSTDKQRALLHTEFHGRKYYQAYTGALFLGANPVGVTTSAGLSTTYVGLCLSNPAANTKNLVIRAVAGAFIVAPATVTGINLITGYVAAGVTVHTTALAPFSALIGTGPAATGLLDSACTLVGTPIYTRVLGETLIATDLPSFAAEIEGGIVLPPGAYCAIGTTIAGPTAGFMGSFEWEEVPV